mmetsp:Transcript_75035/g.208620  ORF Transcript_75035/g.208620 Transcript_75035/m.208620 type:complete len:200 (-) Transcript_75035:1104-1703(-)
MEGARLPGEVPPNVVQLLAGKLRDSDIIVCTDPCSSHAILDEGHLSEKVTLLQRFDGCGAAHALPHSARNGHEHSDASAHHEVHPVAHFAPPDHKVTWKEDTHVQDSDDFKCVIDVTVHEVGRAQHVVVVDVDPQSTFQSGGEAALGEQRRQRLLVVAHALELLQVENAPLQPFWHVEGLHSTDHERLLFLVHDTQHAV